METEDGDDERGDGLRPIGDVLADICAKLAEGIGAGDGAAGNPRPELRLPTTRGEGEGLARVEGVRGGRAG
jgi:hypothetical protein